MHIPPLHRADFSPITLPSTAVTQWETPYLLEGLQPDETVTLQAKMAIPSKISARWVDSSGQAVDAEVILPSWLESGLARSKL